jgi:hypothetical protein
MTNLDEFLRRVEREVRTNLAVGRATCEAFAELPVESRSAYDSAMRYLGCNSPDLTTSSRCSASAADRVRASRLMLLKFFREPSNPAWSSCLLERLAEAAMVTPGGSVGDLLSALHEILGEPDVALTATVTNLIRDVVVTSFTQHRASYESSDFTGMIRKTIEGATPAQSYLALLAIPPERMTASCASAILEGLKGLPYWIEGMDMLADVVQHSGRHDVDEWGADGLRKTIEVGIEPADRGEAAPFDVDAAPAHARSHRQS